MGLFGKLFRTRDIKKNECLVCGELIDLEFKTCYTCKKEDKKQLNATINTKKIYKRDMDGLVSFFKDFPHSHKLYNELSSLAFESRTVKKYLNEANILINDQLKNEAEQGLNDVADFLYEILKTQKNSYKEWREFKKNSVIPKNIPKRPDLSYDNEWKGWGDFLGKEK